MAGTNNEKLSARYVRIAGVVALYWFVSITLVFLNKQLLSGSSTFSAPLFVTWFQCVVTVALLYLLQALFAIFPRCNEHCLTIALDEQELCDRTLCTTAYSEFLNFFQVENFWFS